MRNAFQLKPCPFCGTAVEMTTEGAGVVIRCPRDGCRCLPATYPTIADAVAGWNRPWAPRPKKRDSAGVLSLPRDIEKLADDLSAHADDHANTPAARGVMILAAAALIGRFQPSAGDAAASTGKGEGRDA